MKLKHLLALAALATMGGGNAWAQGFTSGSTYYLQNVETGRFISSGATWGTKATLSPVMDIATVLEADGANWKIKTQGSQYLGKDAFVDQSAQAWTIEAVAGEANTYTVKASDKYLGNSNFEISKDLTEINAATKWIIKSVAEYEADMDNASATKPVNCSFYIKAPNASYINNPAYASTWSGVTGSVERRTDLKTDDNNRKVWTALSPYTVQIYNGTGTTSQSITVKKAGVYAVGVYGFYRASARDKSEAYLYAGDDKVMLKFVEDDAQTTSQYGCTYARNGKYVPNTNSAAGEAFAHGLYKNVLLIQVDNPANAITIGIKKEKTESGDWTCWDNFFLDYYGDADMIDVIKSIHSSVISEYNTAYNAALGVNQSAKMNATVLAELRSALTNYAESKVVTSDATELSIKNAIASINDAVNAAKTSIANYKAVNDLITAQSAIVANFDEEGKAAYNIESVLTKYNDGTITDGAEEIAALKAALQTAVRAQGVGGDYTVALSNPDFKTDDLTGWNMNGKATPTVDVVNHDCEFYEKTFDLSQEVSNLKKGTYEISVQAFQRPGDANNQLATDFVNDNWTSNATLYTTAQTSDVKHICEDWSDTRLYGTGGWGTDSEVTPEGGTKHYLPNCMAGGRVYFDAGKYVTTVKAVVLEDGGSLTFGFRGQQPSKSWILFDNFTLTYIDAAVLIDEEESDKLIASATALESKKMTATIKTALTNAKNELSGDKTNGTKYNALKDAIADAQASIDAYVALNTVLTNGVYIDRSAAFGTEFTYRAEAQTMYDNATETTANVNTKANGMQLAYRNYVKGIANGKCEVGLVAGARDNSKWEYTTGAANNKKYDNKANNDLAANTMWENYKAGGLTDGDMKQTVTVPNGTYFLRMVSFTRSNPMINENDYIYIKSGDATETSISFGESDTPNGFVNITNPIKVTNGQVEIGLHVGSGADWAAIGGVVLYAVEIDDHVRKITANEFGTICLPYAATVEGATVYSATVNAEDNVVELGTVDNMEAGVAYIYQATAAEQTFAYSTGNILAAPSAEGNLKGVFAATKTPAGTYVLLKKNDKDGFYKVKEGEEPTIKAYRAYLEVPTEEPTEAFYFDTETAIQAVEALTTGEAEIYDLNGVKQQSLQKGINIVKMANGKTQKVLVK